MVSSKLTPTRKTWLHKGTRKRKVRETFDQFDVPSYTKFYQLDSLKIKKATEFISIGNLICMNSTVHWIVQTDWFWGFELLKTQFSNLSGICILPRRKGILLSVANGNSYPRTKLYIIFILKQAQNLANLFNWQKNWRI